MQVIFRREQTHLHLCQRTRIKPCHSHEKQLGHIDRKPFTDISTTHAHSKHARMTRTHAKRTRNAHETSTVTGSATLRSLTVPNPHRSPPPSSLSPPQPALFAVTTSHCSDHFRFRSLPVSITSGSHLVEWVPYLREHVCQMWLRSDGRVEKKGGVQTDRQTGRQTDKDFCSFI